MVTEDSPLAGVGARVRAARKLTPDLTQQRLADRAHVSLSLVKAVEQGRAPATAGFVAAIAPVLGLTVYDLWGQPSPRYGQERAGVAALETAVMAGPALASDDPPHPLDELADQVHEITRLRKNGRYDLISARIPDLIEDLHTVAVHQAPGADTERAQRLLAISYDDAMRCLHALGSPVAGQAAERAATAAEGSGDPLLVAHRTGWGIGLALMHRGSFAAATRLAERSLAAISEQPTGPGALTIRGTLHLRLAILAARRGDRPSSDLHLDEAAAAAAHLPEISDLYDTTFCAPNVQIHRVATAVELNDGTTAVSRDRPLPAGLAVVRKERLGHHYVDLARGWLLHGDRDKTFAALRTAREHAPQLVRYHPSVHETLVVLAETDRRRSDSLAGFARWAGVTYPN